MKKFMIISALSLLPITAFAQAVSGTPPSQVQPIDYARGLAQLLNASQSREIESAAALSSATTQIKTLQDQIAELQKQVHTPTPSVDPKK